MYRYLGILETFFFGCGESVTQRPKDVELKQGVSVHAHPTILPHNGLHPYLCHVRRDGWPNLALRTANGKSNFLLVYGECCVIGW